MWNRTFGKATQFSRILKKIKDNEITTEDQISEKDINNSSESRSTAFYRKGKALFAL